MLYSFDDSLEMLLRGWVLFGFIFVVFYEGNIMTLGPIMLATPLRVNEFRKASQRDLQLHAQEFQMTKGPL